MLGRLALLLRTSLELSRLRIVTINLGPCAKAYPSRPIGNGGSPDCLSCPLPLSD